MQKTHVLLLILLTKIAAFGQTSGIPFIKVDQFGYLPNQEKVAVLSNPQTGFNASDSYTPGTVIEVRKVSDSTTVFSSAAAVWNSGASHGQSGDKVWWFDFSSLTAYGEYFIYDPDNDIFSESFRINDLVYKDALRESMRTFFYQRCGIAKSTPHSESQWSDGICHHGSQQDLDCRLVTNPILSTSKDLSGGWHDAGDYNKYINYAAPTVHDLLFAYEFYPGIWHEDFNIPESGNGIEDILDEIKYELDWMLKMQESNGSVLHKVSAINWDNAESPPSAEGTVRRYAPATASATISACGVFAHAAIIFRNHSNSTLQTYGQTLETAAVAAWDWLMANPSQIPSSYNNTGFQNASAENSAYTQYATMVADAAYLLVLTDETDYRTYFDDNYQYCHLFTWGAISYNFDDPWVNDGLLYYQNSALANASVVDDINAEYLDAMNSQWSDFAPLYALNNELDAYRAYLDVYDWGSNQYKANGGTSFISMIHYGIDATNNTTHENGAAGYIHYLHGVNPLAQNYLTNMDPYGTGNSVPEFYHLWFADGTDFDNVNTSLYGPAPGFLVGGPNENYSLAGQNLEPPENQPAQKSYLSWNTPEDDSWEITENQIIYQAAYTRLLAHFISENSNAEPENLLTNPGAEPGVSPCYCFNSGPAIQQSSLEKHTGDYSFLSSNRTQYYDGPAFNILPLVSGGQLVNGKRYTFSVWVWQEESTGKSLYLNLKQTDGLNGISSYFTIEDEYCEPGTWTKLVGHHTLDYSGVLSNLELYVVSSSGTTFDFYADDFFVGETENYTPPTSSTATDFIRASGTNLVVGASSETLVLDGINVTVPVDSDDDAEDIWDVKSISEQDFQNIAKMGFNAIRLHMNYVMFEDDANPGVYKDDGWHWLDRAINLAKEAGLYVLLDMHAPPGGYQSDKTPGFSAFWDGTGAAPNTSNQERLINLWGAIAERYKHEPAIAGYDLINEPRPNNSEEWYTYAEQIIDEIRNYDDNHLICVEVPLISGYTMRLIDDDNVLYDSHFYYTWGYVTQYSAAYGNSGQEWGKYDPDDPVYVDWDGDIVSQGTPNSEAFDDSYLENYLLDDILTFTANNSVPANVGEFGIVWEAYAEDVGAMQYMRDLYNIFDGNNATAKTVSRFYFSYQGNTFGLYNTWTGFQTNENDATQSLSDFFANVFSWKGSKDTNWDDAENWTTELVPEADNNIVIPATANQPAINNLPNNPAICNNLTIESGATLSVNSAKALTVTGNLENHGTLLLKSDAVGTASLIHNLEISGQAERYIEAWSTDFDGWHQISSSVSGQAISDFHDLSTDDFFKWEETSGEWVNRKRADGSLNNEFETDFVPGKGYLIAKKNSETPEFSGPFNVTDIDISELTNTPESSNPGWHLLGNPYSSSLVWNETDGEWALLNIAANCLIWNETNASYDVIGPDEIIPQANGFFIYTTGNGSLTIPISSRTHSDKNWLKNVQQNKSILLQAIDSLGGTLQKTEIRFNDEATADFDLEFDSYFNAGYAPAFYSVSNDENYLLNTLPLVDMETEIPLGFIRNSSYDFCIKMASSTESVVYLTDLKTGQLHNLSINPSYHFISDVADDPIRFLLSVKSTGLSPDSSPDYFKVTASPNEILIKGSNGNESITLIDVLGRPVSFDKKACTDITEIKGQFKNGIYFLSVRSEKYSKTFKLLIAE